MAWPPRARWGYSGSIGRALKRLMVAAAGLALLVFLYVQMAFFLKGKAIARQRACLTNLQQICRGLELYAADN